MRPVEGGTGRRRSPGPLLAHGGRLPALLAHPGRQAPLGLGLALSPGLFHPGVLAVAVGPVPGVTGRPEDHGER
ncbi:hypothetical protein [Streptomyces sp. NPDC051567]|uniref:hypothetical protein n=1 Tax=Streptomyces sp. NPDC051567 TaxID=3365660 RepID=UPI00378846DD